MPITDKRPNALQANNAEVHAETVAQIKKALLSLMEQKKYDKISMTDVIRESGISRAGVYYNYKSQDDILLDVCQKPIDEVVSALGNSVFDNLDIAFRTGRKHADAINAVLAAGLEHVFLYRMNKRAEDSPASCYILLWNGMIFNAFFEWARAGMPGSAEDAAREMKDALQQVGESIGTGLTRNARSAQARSSASSKEA